MNFKLINSDRFPLNGTQNRFWHIATVHMGVREFMCFKDEKEQKVYIEEIIGGHLEFIDSDDLAQAINYFLTNKNVLDIVRPFPYY